MGNEVRLIDANALLRKLIDSGWLKCDITDSAEMIAVQSSIDDAPTIDTESLRQKGRWLGEGDGYADGEIVYDVWYCSECNYCIDDGTDDPEMLPNYCPNCGAKMEG